MTIDGSFHPLFRFVSLAVSPSVTLTVTGTGGGSPVPVNVAPASMPAEAPFENRHQLKPTVEASLLAADEDLSPYAPLARYRVMAKDAAGNTWVTLNAPTDEIPPPPNRRSGPIGCPCPNVDGMPGPRYGEMEDESWRFGPSWLDETRPGMPYIPDLFRGAGPCFARDYTGLLHQWDDTWLVEEGGKQRLNGEVAAYFKYCDDIDTSALAALDLRATADSVGPPDVGFSRDEVKRHWDRFVGVTLERRGRIAERLVRGSRWLKFREEHPDLWYDVHWSGIFDYAPVGVWIRDTPARARAILQFIDDGVPVYYFWKPEFAKLEELSALFPSFAYTPKTPPGSPPKRSAAPAPGNPPAHSRSPPPRAGDEADTSGEFSDHQPEGFWETANRRLDENKVEERALGRARIRSPPPPVLPTSPRSATTPATGANSTPLVVPVARKPASGTVKPAAAVERLAQPRDMTAGELYTLVPPPLKLRLNTVRPSGGRLQRIVADAMVDDSADETTQPELSLREGSSVDENAPALARRMQVRRELPRLFVYDILSVKMKIQTFLMGRDSPTDVFRLMQFLLGVNIQYVSGVKVPPENVDSTKWERRVRNELWLDASRPHYIVYRAWRRNLSEQLDTARIARAVQARGGLMARLAKYDGSILDLWREPTPEVYAHGSPRSVVHEGVTFYGDWLSDEEMRVFVGASGPTGPGSSSLFPPVDIFDKFYDGFWSPTWEQWFSKRIEEIRKGTPGVKVMYTAHEWERRMKGSEMQ